MKSVTELIKDDTMLAARLALVLDSGLPDFLKSTYAERARVRSNWWFSITAVLFIFAISISLYILDIQFVTLPEKAFGLLIMLWAVVFFISGRRWFVSKRLLAQEMNMAMTPLLTNALNAMMLYTYSSESAPQVTDTITGLAGTNTYQVFSKDRYQVFTTPAFQCDEVIIRKKGSSLLNALNALNVCEGVLVTATVGEKWNGLYVMSEAKNDFFDTIAETLTSSAEELTHMFTGKYRVYKASDYTATESPQLLTELLRTFAESHPDGFVLAVTDGQLQLLLVNSSIKILLGSATTDRTVIARQGYRILLPIWNAARLVEGMNK